MSIVRVCLIPYQASRPHPCSIIPVLYERKWCLWHDDEAFLKHVRGSRERRAPYPLPFHVSGLRLLGWRGISTFSPMVGLMSLEWCPSFSALYLRVGLPEATSSFATCLYLRIHLSEAAQVEFISHQKT